MMVIFGRKTGCTKRVHQRDSTTGGNVSLTWLNTIVEPDEQQPGGTGRGVAGLRHLFETRIRFVSSYLTVGVYPTSSRGGIEPRVRVEASRRPDTTEPNKPVLCPFRTSRRGRRRALLADRRNGRARGERPAHCGYLRVRGHHVVWSVGLAAASVRRLRRRSCVTNVTVVFGGDGGMVGPRAVCHSGTAAPPLRHRPQPPGGLQRKRRASLLAFRLRRPVEKKKRKKKTPPKTPRRPHDENSDFNGTQGWNARS